jgi:PAS domain S-box-containing protein
MQRYDEIRAIAELKLDQLTHWRQSQLEDVSTIAKGPLFKKAVDEWLVNPSRETASPELTGRLVILREEMHYTDALITDLEGKILLSANPQPEDLNEDEKDTIKEVIQSGSPKLTGIYRNATNQIAIATAALIYSPNNRPIAVILLRSNPELNLYPLIHQWPTSSKTAETLLVRRDGNDALYLNDLRHKSGTALTLHLPLTMTDLPAVQAVLGKEGISEGKDYRGVKVIADLRAVPKSTWYLITKMDESEVLREVYYHGIVILLFASLFILLATSVVGFVYRGQRVHVYLKLYQAEQDKREAEETSKAILYSIGDGVITTNTEGLIVQMNPVAEHLTGWTEQEAISKPLKEVFVIIDQQTRQSCMNPVQKVIESGRVEGLANCTLLISRDGTERILADSGAPIWNDNGDMSGVVLVFRDVSEKSKIEEKFRSSEIRYRRLFECAQDGILILDFDDGKIIDANPYLIKMLGYSHEDFLEKFLWEVSPFKDTTLNKDAFSELQQKGYVRYEDLPLETGDGRSIEVEFVSNSYTVKGASYIQCNIRDISDRKFAEQALAESKDQQSKQQLVIQKTEDRIKTLEIAKTKDLLESSRLLNSGIAHELRSPMQALLNCFELIKEETCVECPVINCEKRQECLDKAQNIIDYVTDGIERSEYSIKVLNSLAEYSKTASNSDLHSIDVVAELKTIMKALMFTNQFKGLSEEEFSLESTIGCRILINRIDFTQLISNLCRNSLEAITPKEPRIKIAVYLESPNIKIIVTDNGKGIDKTLGDKIFEPYFSTKENPEEFNQGLGLAMVRDITSAYGGSVRYTSEPGHTEFTVTFPCSYAETMKCV